MLNSLFPLEARLGLIFTETFHKIKIKRQTENGMTTTLRYICNGLLILEAF